MSRTDRGWRHAHLACTVLSASQAFSELTPSVGAGVTCPGSHSKRKAAGASHGSRVSFGLSIPRSQPLSCFGSLALDWSQREIRSGAFMAGFKLPGRADRLGK